MYNLQLNNNNFFLNELMKKFLRSFKKFSSTLLYRWYSLNCLTHTHIHTRMHCKNIDNIGDRVMSRDSITNYGSTGWMKKWKINFRGPTWRCRPWCADALCYENHAFTKRRESTRCSSLSPDNWTRTRMRFLVHRSESTHNRSFSTYIARARLAKIWYCESVIYINLLRLWIFVR